MDNISWANRLAQLGIAHAAGQDRHRAILAALLAHCSQDPRIGAVHLKGSISHGEGDAYSDLDVMIAVEPGHWPALWDERREFAARFGRPAIEMNLQWGPVTDSVCYAVIYDNGVYLDLFIRRGPLPAGEDAVTVLTRDPAIGMPPSTQYGASPTLTVVTDPLADVFALFWMGSSLCANYIMRGDLWQALEFVSSRRSLLLKAWRIVHWPDRLDWGWHSASKDLPADVLEALAETVSTLDAREMARALIATLAVMEQVGPELARQRGIAYPAEGAATIQRLVRERLATLVSGI